MISSPDYSRDFPQLVALLDSIVFQRAEPKLTAEEALHLRNALADFRGMGTEALKRKAELQQDARDEGYDSIDVVVRDLTFADVHAFIQRGDCPDMCAEGQQVLTAYYTTYEDDEERVRVALHCVVPTAPLVIKGEERDLVIGAGSDILHSLTKDRQDEIKDKVMDAIRMLQGEARIEMAEAA